MSAIAGCVGRIDHPGRRAQKMVETQSHRGPDGSATVDFDCGAFGHAMLHNSPESLTEAQPFVHKETGCIITADIRLDNRDYLLAELISPRRKPAEVGDAELALNSYLWWGPSFATRLLGAFAIAIWDPRSHELLLCRDQIGVRPIVYAASATSIVFGSTVESVRDASPQQHPPLVEKLQHYLVDPLEAADQTTTVLDGILRVPRSTVATWSRDQGLRLRSYWKLEPQDRLNLPSDQAYLDAFNEVFDQAVAARLRRPAAPIGSMLSGGIDSTGVVTSACRQLSSAADLTTYSGVETTPGAGSDTPHIRAVVQQLQLRSIEVNEHDVVEHYALDRILSKPDSLFGSDLALSHVLLAQPAANNDRILLSGIVGDELFRIDQLSYARTLARSGALRRAWRELARFDGLTGGPRWAGRRALSALTPKPIKDVRRPRLLRRQFSAALHHAGISETNSSTPALWDAYQRLASHPDWTTGDRRFDAVWSPYGLVGFERYDRTAARYGVEIRSPFSDRRLIEFCLSLPDDQLQRDSWQKWILRKSLAPYIPSSVAWRPKSADALSPFAAAKNTALQPAAEEIINELPGVFDALSGDNAAAERCSISRPERLSVVRWLKP